MAIPRNKFYDLSDQVDGVSTTFTVRESPTDPPQPFLPDSLRVWLAGELQLPVGGFVASVDDAAGTFEASEVPDLGDELQVRVELGEIGFIMTASGIDPDL